MYTTPPFSHNYSNPVLMKDDVGKPKPSTFNLPKQDFIYGLPLTIKKELKTSYSIHLPHIKDKEGAKEVTMTWKFHHESQDRIPNRDFPELNKMSVFNGSLTAHDMYKFRQTHDARLQVKKGTNIQAIELPEEEFRYGRKNRPSTPMKLVMGNSYGIEAASMTLDKYYKRAGSQETKMTNTIVRPNKASQLFHESNHKKLAVIKGTERKEPFKMEKFKTVSARTNTNLLAKKE